MPDTVNRRIRLTKVYVFAARSLFLSAAFFLTVFFGAILLQLTSTGPGRTAEWLTHLGGSWLDLLWVCVSLVLVTGALWVAQVRLMKRLEREEIVGFTLAEIEKEMGGQELGSLLPGLTVELEKTLRQAGYTASGWKVAPVVRERDLQDGCSIAKNVVDTFSSRLDPATAYRLRKLPLIPIAHSH